MVSKIELLKKMKRIYLILTIDSIAALSAGSFVLLLTSALSVLYEWNESFTRFIGYINISYGFYSGTLILLLKYGYLRRAFIFILIAANTFWSLQCLAQVWRLAANASYFGIAHLLFEGIFVGVLAYLEGRFILPNLPQKTSHQ